MKQQNLDLGSLDAYAGRVAHEESAMDDRSATREKCGVAELTARATKVEKPFLAAAPVFMT